MARRIQDFKFGFRDQIGTILWDAPLCDGITMENVTCERMADHYASKSDVDGVRVVGEDGDELFRWTRRDEAKRAGKTHNA